MGLIISRELERVAQLRPVCSDGIRKGSDIAGWGVARERARQSGRRCYPSPSLLSNS